MADEAMVICEGCGETVEADDVEDGLCEDCREEEIEEAEPVTDDE